MYKDYEILNPRTMPDSDDDGNSPSDTFCNTLSQLIFFQVNDFSATIDLDNTNDFVKKLNCTQFTSSKIIVKVNGRDIIVEAEQEEQHEGVSGPSSLNKTFYNDSDSYDLENVEALLGLVKVLTLFTPRKDKKTVYEESPSNIKESGKSLINVERC